MNARFWLWWNHSPVKLTMKPDQRIEFSRWESTDEGWSAEAESFSFDGFIVERESVNDGKDCDGRLTQTTMTICHLDQLKAGYEENEEIQFANWDKVRFWQRDQFAELANY